MKKLNRLKINSAKKVTERKQSADESHWCNSEQNEISADESR